MTTQRTVGVTALVMGLIAAIWLAASPYYTLYQIKSAIDDRNAQALNEHVDYPALRESIKGELNAQMMAKVKEEGGPNAAASVMGMAFASGMIDTMLRPETIEMLLEQQAAKIAEASKDNEGSYEIRRTSIGRFEVAGTNDNMTEEMSIQFELQGFTWRVVGLKIDLDSID